MGTALASELFLVLTIASFQVAMEYMDGEYTKPYSIYLFNVK